MKTKRILAFMLSVVMILSVFSANVAFAVESTETSIFAGGGGTKSDPWQIANLAQLEAFRNSVNNGENYNGDYIKLTADINLGGGSNNQWTPIGRYNASFEGTFDGDGHGITGFYAGNADLQGFFGRTSGATIKNLTVSGNINITEENYIRLAGIIAEMDSGTVENCVSNVNIKVNYNASRSEYIGGIVGDASGTFTIKKCYNTGTISGYLGTAGGILGHANDSSGIVENCYNTGGVASDISGSGASIGGIIGYAAKITVKNCYNIGTVAAKSAYCVGGAVGNASDSSNGVSSVYYLDSCKGTGTDFDSKYGTQINANQMKNKDTFSGWDFDEVWYMDSDKGRPLFKKTVEIDIPLTTDKYDLDGDEVKDKVYEISDADDLVIFANAVNNGQNKINAVLLKDISLYNRTWTPIGVNYSDFKGIFDGRGHTVYDMKFTTEQNGYDNHPEYNYQGLFGVMRDGAEVRNLTVKGDITIYTDKEIYYVGGAVGLAYEGCKISNVTSYVNITDNGVGYEKVESVGGVVGQLGNRASNGTPGFADNCKYYGTISINKAGKVGGIVGAAIKDSFVTNCTNYGKVGWDYIGHLAGIAGAAETGATVKNCANYGEVTSGSDDCIGGVVGYANEYVTITNCLNGGDVKGKKATDETSDVYLGGILGYQNNTNFNGVTNCFNYGTLTATDNGTTYTGAIVGYSKHSVSAPRVKDNYYLSTSCAKSCGGNDGSNNISVNAIQAASGEIAYKMQSYITDGEQVWGQKLSGENAEEYPAIHGTKVYALTNCNGCVEYANEEKTISHSYVDNVCENCGASQTINKNDNGYYEIGSKAEYIHFTNLVNTNGEQDILNAVLTANIDLSGYEYVPIGKDGSRYIGTFDGAGYKIENMTITAKSNNTAMFGCTLNATLKDFTLSGDITAVYNGLEHIGGVIGYANATSVSNVISKVNFKDNGKIEHIFKAGGIAARAVSGSHFTDCEYNGNVTLHFGSHMAGILGEANEATKDNPIVITNCVNKGNMRFDISRRIGGILGWNDTYTNVLKCANYGDITITESDRINQAGGIVATTVNALSVKDCANYGNISDGKFNSSLGGIVGFIDAYKNTDDFVGIANCFNYGTITNTNEDGSTYWGSVIGYIKNDEANQSNTSKITDNYYLEDTAPQISGTEGIALSANKVSADMALSGELAYKLQGTRTNSVWGQNLLGESKTAYPVLNGEKVYKITFVVGDETYATKYANKNGIGALPETSGNRKWFCGPQISSGEFTAETAISSDMTVYSLAVPDLIITTAEELKAFANEVNGGNSYKDKYILLQNDLDLNGSEENQWTAIGTYLRVFEGTFDGDGHKISGLYINNSEPKQGLFGYVDEGSTVKNLGVDGTVKSGQYSGGVVGENRGAIENCYSDCNVSGADDVGGVAGYNYGTVKNCYNTGNVSGTSYVGGAVGYDSSAGKFDDCFYLDTCAAEGTTFTYKKGEALTAVQMKNSANFENWDFENIWIINIDRPLLKNNLEVQNFEVKSAGTSNAKATAAVFVPNAGKFTVVFADYKDGALDAWEAVEVEIAKENLGLNTVVSTKDLILGAGDKVMIWNNVEAMKPMSEVFEVK